MPVMEKVVDDPLMSYLFYCPGCGNHHYINDGWVFNGDLERPTITPSVKITMGPEYDPNTYMAKKGAKNRICHFFIKEGKIQYLSDCFHELAGKTIDMVDLKEV